MTTITEFYEDWEKNPNSDDNSEGFGRSPDNQGGDLFGSNADVQPLFRGRVYLNDAKTIFVNVFSTEGELDLKSINLLPLKDMLGVETPEEHNFYEELDNQPPNDLDTSNDDIRVFPDAESAIAFLEETGLWDFSEWWYDDINDIWFIRVGDSP